MEPVSRESLYALVWAEPMTRVAERFGVSGSYMARVCELMYVPRPERGYWAKLAVGKAPSQPPLPEPRPEDLLHWSRDQQLPRLPSPPRQPLVARIGRRVAVAKDRSHPLTSNVRSQFENSRTMDDEAYLKPFKQLLVDITTSMACLDKSLSDLGALCRRVIDATTMLHVQHSIFVQRLKCCGHPLSPPPKALNFWCGLASSKCATSSHFAREGIRGWFHRSRLYTGIF